MAWTEGDITTQEAVRIHYYRRGHGRPLILAHGATDNGECWTRAAEAFEGGFDIVAYDARYHGLSDAPPQQTPGSGGADLIAVAEALGIERPAIMGHSMGAASVMAAAAAQATRFACAILEDPYLRMESSNLEPKAPPANPAPRALLPDFAGMSLESIEAAGRKDNPLWDDSEFAPWARAKKQFRRPPGDFGLPAAGAWRTEMAAMALPTLLIHGGNRERFGLVSDKAAAQAQELNPQLRAVRLDDAGHNVRREAFAPFIAAVRAFLAEHP